MVSVLKAHSLRLKYLTSYAYTAAIKSNRTAVVVGATSGIGRACANRLAEQGYKVIAVGRDRPGRAESIIKELNEKSSSSLSSFFALNSNDDRDIIAKHEFYPCDAFSLSAVQSTAKEIESKHPTIDVLILTQGMATTQGFTPTKEGNDEKMTLHYYSRIAMALAFIPALRQSSKPKGAVVMTVLSGGVHSSYKKIEEDVELKENYSVMNAADAAGYYTDLGFDYLSLREENHGINFVHASPGFVNTNWGTEFNVVLRTIVRCMQPLGKTATDCADYLLSSSVFAADSEEENDGLPKRLNGEHQGIHIIGEIGEAKALTQAHTHTAKEFIWNHTCAVLEKSGIRVE